MGNPDFVDDAEVYAFDSFGVAAFEIWQVKAGTIFDNVYIGDSLDEAKEFAEATFSANKDGEKKMYDDAKEAEKKAEEEAAAKAQAEADAAAEEEEEPEEEDDEDDEAAAAARKEKLEKLKDGKDEL